MPSITKIVFLVTLATTIGSSLNPVIVMSITSLGGITIRRQGAAAVPLLIIVNEPLLSKAIGKYIDKYKNNNIQLNLVGAYTNENYKKMTHLIEEKGLNNIVKTIFILKL